MSSVSSVITQTNLPSKVESITEKSKSSELKNTTTNSVDTATILLKDPITSYAPFKSLGIKIQDKEPQGETLVFGHLNPDLDTTASTIAYARIKGAKPRLLGKPDKETIHFFKKFQLDLPELFQGDITGKNVVLIDHNSEAESVVNVKKANILRVIDHHKPSLTFPEPISMTIRPIGATATLMAEKLFRSNKDNKELAGILLCAIISDTLGFISPTTAKRDLIIAKKIAEKYSFDIPTLVKEIMEVKSDIEGTPIPELLKQDGKTMAFKNRKVFVSQIIDNNNKLNSIKKEMVQEMERLAIEKQYDAVLLMQTNTFTKTTVLWIVTKPNDISKIFGRSYNFDEITLKDVVSRKQDIVPKLESALSQKSNVK